MRIMRTGLDTQTSYLWNAETTNKGISLILDSSIEALKAPCRLSTADDTYFVSHVKPKIEEVSKKIENLFLSRSTRSTKENFHLERLNNAVQRLAAVNIDLPSHSSSLQHNVEQITPEFQDAMQSIDFLNKAVKTYSEDEIDHFTKNNFAKLQTLFNNLRAYLIEHLGEGENDDDIAPTQDKA